MRIRRKELCRAGLVLETIKKTKGKGGMTSAQINLAEAQAEDYAYMKKELQGLKSDMCEVRKDFGDFKVKLGKIETKIETLLEISNKPKLTENKYFWVFITVVACLLAGVTHIPEIMKVFGG